MKPDFEAISAEAGEAGLVQVAVNGVWESCLAIEPSQNVPVATIEEFIGDDTDVAFEVFFHVAGGAPSFVGVRLNGHSKQQQAQIIADCVKRVHAGKWVTVADVIDGLRERVEHSLYTCEPDFMELGVTNLWKSAGPVMLWRAEEAVLDTTSLRKKLDAHPHIRRVFPMPLGLDRGFSHPIPHWLSTPVSRQVDGGHRLSFDLVAEAMQLKPSEPAD